MSDYLFTQEHATSTALISWWNNLENNKGDRAELRRCQTVTEIIGTPAYHIIYRRLVMAGLPDEPANDRVPVLVAIAALTKAHLPSSDRDSFAKTLSGKAAGSDRPKFSANRFRALLQTETPNELLTALRRALPLIDSSADVRQLASDIYYWGEKVQRRWAYAYNWPARNAG